MTTQQPSGNSFFDRLISPRHRAFWGLLASIAAVIGVVITIVSTMSGGAGTQQDAGLSTGHTPVSAAPAATQSQAASTDATTSTSASSPAGKVYLSTLKPVSSPYAAVVAGPVQFGTTTYQQSIRFTCEGGQSSVVYDVAGFSFLDATIDVPNDATNAAGQTAKITFLKNGTSTQLSQPITDVVGKPQPIHLDLQGSAQLDISCVATDALGGYSSMDIALGDATIGPS